MSKTSDSKAKKSDKKKADKKPKRISGQNSGPQGFLPEHGEKLGFALFALVVLLCVWGAMGHEPYTKTPADLTTVLQQRRTAVQQNKPEGSPLLEGTELRPFKELAMRSVEPVDWSERTPPPTTRDPKTPWVLKRGEPELYPPIDGKPHAMFYPVAFKEPDAGKKKAVPGKATPKAKDDKKKEDPLFGDLLGGGAAPKANKKKAPRDKVPAVVQDAGPIMDAPVAAGPVEGVQVPPDMPFRGQPMVMLTWRVPRAKQTEAFRRVFENARDYDFQRDTANYVSFWIERKVDDGPWEGSVTINTPRGGTKTMWLQLASWETQKNFPLFATEVVDTAQEDCIVPFEVTEEKDKEPALKGFTMSLPPVLGDDFDERAAGGFPVIKVAPEPGFPGAMADQPGAAAPGAVGPGAAAPGAGVPRAPVGVKAGAGQPGAVLPGGPGGAKGPGAVLPGGAPGVGPGGAPAVGPAPGFGARVSGQRGKKKYPGVGPDGAFGGKAAPGGGAWSGGGGGAKMIGGRPAGEAGASGGPRTTGNSGGGGGAKMVGGRPAGEVGSGVGPRSTGNDGGGAKMIGGRPAGEVGAGVGPRAVGNNAGVGAGNPWDKKQSQGGAAAAAQPVQVAQLSDILLRFFDFTVEEGHTYQYRVQVILKNPNHKLPLNLLKEPKYAAEEVLKTEFSEPTEPVRVTIGGGEVIAGPVRAARPEGGYADSATAIFRQRNRTTGALSAYTFNRVEAGQVLNFNVKDSTNRGIKFETPVGGIDSAAEFAFQSDNLVLDLRGDRGSPGEMLLLDASGRLTVQSEVGASPNFAGESKRLEDVYNR